MFKSNHYLHVLYLLIFYIKKKNCKYVYKMNEQLKIILI
jgi:hypothetical protein